MRLSGWDWINSCGLKARSGSTQQRPKTNVTFQSGIALARDVVQRRINEGLTDGELLFPRAKTVTFDHAVARACRNAGKLANLNYGRTNGFTCHSLRHTFVTRMMEATGNDVALVMSYSGHKSLDSFKIYLHPTQQGCILATQEMDRVGEFLGTFHGQPGQSGHASLESEAVKPLEIQQVAV